MCRIWKVLFECSNIFLFTNNAKDQQFERPDVEVYSINILSFTWSIPLISGFEIGNWTGKTRFHKLFFWIVDLQNHYFQWA